MLGTSKSISGFDPRTVPGCQLWLDAADQSSMTLSGSNVTQWIDKSGNGYNFVTQGSFAAPVISNNAISTNSAVSFTGNSTQNDTANQILTNSSFPLNPSGAGYSIFAVTRQNASHPSYSGYNYILSAYGGGTGAGLLYGTTNSNLFITANGTSGAFYGFNDLTANVPNTLMTSTNQTCMIVSGSVLTPYLNGVAMSTKTGTSDAVTGISIGNAYAPGQTFTGQTWGGLICEVFIYNSALTTSQRQQVEGYLAHKWGLVPYYNPTTPLAIPGCQLWLDGADPAGTGTAPASGATVSTWNDKSGNGKHATATGTITYLSGGGVNFNGSSYFLNQTFSQNLSQRSIFVVFNETSHTDYAGVFPLIPTPNSGFDQLTETGLSVEVAPNGYGYTLAFFGNATGYRSRLGSGAFFQKAIYYDSMNGTTGSGYFNRVNVTNETATYTAGSCSGYGVGGRWQGGSMDASYRLNGVVHEILFYNRTLTNSERQTIENYLAKKWGIGTNPTIPSTHPFSSVRPHLRPFQPIDVPGCQLWLDGADTGSMTLSGSSVTIWNDKSGNGNNATPYSASPQRVGNSVLFSGSNALKCGKFLTSTSYSVFIVNNFASGFTNKQSFGCWKVEYGSFVHIEDGSIRVGVNNSGNYNLDAVTSTASYTANHIYGLTLNSSSTPGSAFTFNGSIDGSNVLVSGTSTSGNATTCAEEVTIGGLMEDGIPKYQLNGYVYEVLVFNTALTTSQRQQVEGYLAHKWGLTPSLPVISPLSIPGCALWLDGADQSSMTLSGSSITQLRDKSGNGNHMVSNGTSPLYNSSLINSVGGIDCTNGGALISSGIQNSANISFAMVAVVKSGIRNWGSFFTHGDRDYDFAVERQENTSSINFQTANDNSSCTITFTLDAPVLYFGTMTSGTSRFFESFSGGVNTIVNGTNPSTISLGSKIIRVGKSDNNNELCNSFIGEIIYYTTVLTTTQRQQVEGYLARKWGISIGTTLPSPHPFRSIPPATAAHFYPTYISGCQLWLDAADSSAITIGTGVSQWTDKSGNSNNLTQSTTGSQPTYASSLITFANDKYLNIPATVLNNLPTWSLFFVINPISASNWIMSRQRDGVDSYNILSMTISSTNYGGVQSGSVGNLYWRSMNAGTQLGSSDSLTTSTLQTCTLTYDGTILYFYKNGELNQATTGSFAIQNQTSPNTYTLGALIYPSGIDNSGVTNFRLGEMISYNTFLTNAQRERVEGYLAHKWGLLSSLSSINPYKTLPPIFPPIIQYNITAIGGTIVSTVGTTYHVFRTSSSFVVRRSVTVNYLVVGGGGGGGDRHGGGGGAGGVLSGNWSASAGVYIVTVGAGGQYGSTNEGGQIAYGTPNGSGTKGGDSLLSGTGISITAYGGGGGGSYDGNPSGTVGSGGGGGGQNLSGVAGTAGQGNAGGSGSNPGAGGGGGAGGAGVAANTGTGGVGTSSYSTHLLAVGYGTTFAVPTSPNTVISGGVAYIAGGGGGCAGTSPGPGGSGGLGGGGRGDWADANITSGTPNTGGGGGGTRSHPDSLQTTGRNGGSGLVLVWY